MRDEIKIIQWQSEMEFYKNLAFAFIVISTGIVGYVFVNFENLGETKMGIAVFGLVCSLCCVVFSILKYKRLLKKGSLDG